MTETVTKTQTQITREEWIVYQWLDITKFGDTERTYMRGHFRQLSECEQAGRDFDTFHAALDELNKQTEPANVERLKMLDGTITETQT